MIVVRFEGTEDLLGEHCDKFTKEVVDGPMIHKYTVWVSYKDSPNYLSSRMPIPVRSETRKYNTVLGIENDHYYRDFNYYSHEEIPSNVFEVEVGEYTTIKS